MDQFEAARLKHAKNLERKMRTDVVGTQGAKATVAEYEPVEAGGCAPPVLVPKEKVSDALIDVTVTLPTGVLSFRLVKPDVMANVPNHRLTAKEFSRCFVDGLKPLLGAVKE